MANILIIDDNEGMREGMAAVVRRMGHAVRACASGQEGVAAFQKQPADFVITDLKMDGMDGVEVLRRLRDIDPDGITPRDALHLLADIEETEAVVSSSTVNPRGTIRLTCSTSFGVPHLAPAIGAFQAKYPEVHFDISASNRFVDLVEDGLDLAIRIGDIGNPNLIARRLGSMRLIACASPDYLKRRGTPKHPDDLVKHSCFTYEYSPAKNTWPFRNRDGIGRLFEMVQRVFSVSHRMHNKAWIADGRVAVVGGRNIGEEYFSANPEVNFRDLDLLLFGPAVKQASTIFDDYWNSTAAVPVAALARKKPEPSSSDIWMASRRCLACLVIAFSSCTSR